MLVYDQYIYPEKPDTDEDIIVFHSGFCSTTPNYSYGRDTRDYYLIHYVTRGRGTYQAGGRQWQLKENDGFLITPGTTIVHTADKNEPWDLCWVAFFGRKAGDLLRKAGLDEDHLLFIMTGMIFWKPALKTSTMKAGQGRISPPSPDTFIFLRDG